MLIIFSSLEYLFVPQSHQILYLYSYIYLSIFTKYITIIQKFPLLVPYIFNLILLYPHFHFEKTNYLFLDIIVIEFVIKLKY